jgi:hypothetical protein
VVRVTVGVDLHVIVLPVSVVEGLISDVEVPELSISILHPSSKVEPVVAMSFNYSSEEHSGSDVEWSVDVPSEVLVKSLGGFLGSLINIDNLPLLAWLSFVVINNNLLSFFILVTIN